MGRFVIAAEGGPKQADDMRRARQMVEKTANGQIYIDLRTAVVLMEALNEAAGTIRLLTSEHSDHQREIGRRAAPDTLRTVAWALEIWRGDKRAPLMFWEEQP